MSKRELARLLVEEKRKGMGTSSISREADQNRKRRDGRKNTQAPVDNQTHLAIKMPPPTTYTIILVSVDKTALG